MSVSVKFQKNEASLKALAASMGSAIPSDDEIKQIAKAAHRPWGIVKSEMVAAALQTTKATRTPEYLTGWEAGRADKVAGREYSRAGSGMHSKGYYDGYSSQCHP